MGGRGGGGELDCTTYQVPVSFSMTQLWETIGGDGLFTAMCLFYFGIQRFPADIYLYIS